MFKKKYLFFLLSFFLFFPIFGNAQKDRKNLENKRIALKKEIKKIKTYLYNTKKKERSFSNQVKDLNQKIKTRENLISTISDEINLMSTEIEKNTIEIAILQENLNQLKTEYSGLIYKSYKNKSKENRLMFLLSSANFYQGYQRFQYMKQYTKYRKDQGDTIKNRAQVLLVMNDSLTTLKVKKGNLIEEKKNEQGQLSSEKDKQESLVQKYRNKKKEYITQIRKKQKEERQLTKKIENLIKGAIKNSGTKSKTFALTPAAKALANKFESNKGKLPWPVKKGLVTVRFGNQSDPLDKSLKIQSSGVRIATDQNAEALAVFEGKILAISKNPQNGVLTVMVQHGNYISVYANLESIYIEKGSKVKTKEALGVVHTDKVSGKTVLKFQIWKDTNKQNPAHWIYKM